MVYNHQKKSLIISDYGVHFAASLKEKSDYFSRQEAVYHLAERKVIISDKKVQLKARH